MKRLLILGIVAALCLIATPVAALYSCDPPCGANPIGSEKCCFGPDTPVSTNLVTPDLWNDNPTCADLGFDLTSGNQNSAGTYSVGPGSVTWSVDGNGIITWSSTFGIDAVFVKGGNGGNLYTYDPPSESTGDSGLLPPHNCGQNDNQCGLSHVTFCYDNEACDCPVNGCSTGTCDQTGACIYEAPGTRCDGGVGVCDGNGNCGGGNPVPEFPSLALPLAMVVGLLGAVLLIQKTRK